MNHPGLEPVSAQNLRQRGDDKARISATAQLSRHVLYIDDDEPLVWLVKFMLARLGYRVSGYTSASEALSAVRANPHDFDLAITDYSMPGMSGLDVANALRQIRADLPVVLVSACIMPEVRAQAPAAGVREVIEKSATFDALFDAVARLAGVSC